MPTQNELLSLNYKFEEAPLYTGLDDNGRMEMFIVSDQESPINLYELHSRGKIQGASWSAVNCFLVLVR